MENFFGRKKEIMRIRGEEQKMIRLLRVKKNLMKTVKLYHLQDKHFCLESFTSEGIVRRYSSESFEALGEK